MLLLLSSFFPGGREKTRLSTAMNEEARKRAGGKEKKIRPRRLKKKMEEKTHSSPYEREEEGRSETDSPLSDGFEGSRGRCKKWVRREWFPRKK